MARILMNVTIGALFAGTPLAMAGPPGVEIEYEFPMKRRVVAIAEHDGAVTVAGAKFAGAYGDNEDLEAGCRTLPPEKRTQCVECLVYARFNSRRSGDAQAHAVLFQPGYNRSHIEEELPQIPERLRNMLSGYASVHPYGKSVWDDYVFVAYQGVMPNGEERVLNAIEAQWDSTLERYWLTKELFRLFPGYPITYIPVPGHTLGVGDVQVLEKPPQDTRIIRLSVDPQSPPDNRKVIAEALDDRSEIERDDLILYIRDERFPADAPPFLEWDPATLDEAGRQLREALARQLVWHMDEEAPMERLDELVTFWHPSVRDRVHQSLKDVWDAPPVRIRATQEGVVEQLPSDPGKKSKRRASPIPGLSGVREISEMRVAARIYTNQGVIWFAWAPNRNPGRSGPSDAKLYSLLQLRTEDGGYKLIQRPSDVPYYPPQQWNPALWRDHHAMWLCYANPVFDLSGIAHLETRDQRKTQLGGE